MDKQYMEYIALCWLADMTQTDTKLAFFEQFGFMSPEMRNRINHCYTVQCRKLEMNVFGDTMFRWQLVNRAKKGA